LLELHYGTCLFPERLGIRFQSLQQSRKGIVGMRSRRFWLTPRGFAARHLTGLAIRKFRYCSGCKVEVLITII